MLNSIPIPTILLHHLNPKELIVFSTLLERSILWGHTSDSIKQLATLSNTSYKTAKSAISKLKKLSIIYIKKSKISGTNLIFISPNILHQIKTSSAYIAKNLHGKPTFIIQQIND